MLAALPGLALRRPLFFCAAFVAAGAGATILGALFFEHVVGLPPCPLCLEQRVPYYIAIPLAAGLAGAALLGAPGWLVRAGLLAVAAVLAWGAGLGIYHAGAEWGLWQGPTTCALPGDLPRTPADLLRQLQGGPRLADCTVAAWRFLGLSLAGWNALVAAGLAAVALAGALVRRTQA